ncbi:MAG: hypothetical protein N2645_14795 [Clostridia bacterium]|nr:hypothetical protein [Clostridia bacterium]
MYYNDDYDSQNRQFGPPYGVPFFPPFSPPGGPGPGQGPGLGPGTGAGFGPPSGPPPSFTPQQAQAQGFGAYAVDPGAIRPCTYRFVYLWLTNGRQFWAWLTFVGRRSAAGYRWIGFRWVYFGIDLDRIESFICY